MSELLVIISAIIAIIIVFLLSFAYMFTQVTLFITEVITVEQLLEEDGQHCLLLDNRKLKISDASLQLLQFNKYKEYKITYSFNKLNPKKGKVEHLEVYDANVQ